MATSRTAAPKAGTTTAVSPADLHTFHRNARQGDVGAIAASLKAHGQYKPITVNIGTHTGRPREVLAGNHTLMAFRELAEKDGGGRWDGILVHWIDVDDDMANRIVVADNRTSELGGMDMAVLAGLLDDMDGNLDGLGFTEADVAAIHDLLDGDGDPAPGGGGDRPADPPLAERFGVPPFTVLDRRAGRWQARKREWLDMGIDSGDGRADGLTYDVGDRTDIFSETARDIGTTSVFDPHLCEIVYRWFSCAGAAVLDPFSGGSVRGAVAVKLGRTYTGVDVRQEQIDANYRQAEQLELGGEAEWVLGSAAELDKALHPDARYDLVFTCPPYADLETYSDQANDMSTWSYEDFRAGMQTAITGAAALLRDNRYLVVVIGDVRDKRGAFLGLHHDTAAQMRAAGLTVLNEIVLLDPIGSVPLRAARPFLSARKVATTHQHVLVAVKGDQKAAAAWAASDGQELDLDLDGDDGDDA